jgi:serine protease Do
MIRTISVMSSPRRFIGSVALVLAMASSVCAADRPQSPASFAPVAERVKAAVFSVVVPYEDADDSFGERGPARDLLQQLFEALGGRPNGTLGAAVMLEPSGIAVTGARILQGLTEVELVAVDHARYRAIVLGRDDRTDVAVLRMMAPVPLAVARLGDSDEVRVGDWVLAIGSPYGFEASVSAGIVSSRTRIAAGGVYGDRLQTDAAINPGNAGGPLVNTRGEVIGLSSMAAGRSVGVGFATPSNVVRKVVDDIVAHGRVVRGWLGVDAQSLTPDLGRAFGAPLERGLLITDVTAGGPAAGAGLTRGTIVVAIERRTLATLTDLEDVLAVIPPGRVVALDVWRNGRQESISLALGQVPVPSAGRETSHTMFGWAVDFVTPETGVVIISVRPGSPAANAGLRRGDLVRELGRRVIRNLVDFDEASAGIVPGERITLLVQRDRVPSYVVLAPDR